MATRWIDTSFDLDGHRIAVSVQRLQDDDAARLAASLAWFASVAVTPGADLEATDWPRLLQQILSDFVSVTVDDETLTRREELWAPLCSGALRSFVTANQIDPAVTRFLVVPPGRAI